jgi:hypothetical protein
VIMLMAIACSNSVCSVFSRLFAACGVTDRAAMTAAMCSRFSNRSGLLPCSALKRSMM